MAYDGSIKIDTKIDSSGFSSGLNSLSSLAKSGLSGIESAVKAVSAAVAAAATGLGALTGKAIQVGSSFEAGMSQVQAISGATGDELAALAEKAKELGASTKFSATEASQGLKFMAMAGWDTRDMLDGIAGVMSLAAASGEDLGAVSDIVTDALTAFGLQAADSSHFADVLAKAAANSNTNVSMMGATFKYAAPLAGALKYSIEDVAVATGLMANAGIKGEQAGTYLRAMLARLSKPTDAVAEAMDDLGVSLTNADGTVKPLRETLTALRSSFSGLTDAEKTEYAANLAGQEAMSGLLAIVNASEADFNNLTAAIDSSSGAAEEQAAIMQDNLSGALTILGSAAESLGIEVYESIQEPLKGVAKEATNMVNALTTAFKRGGLEGLISEMGVIMSSVLTKITEAAPKATQAGADFVLSMIKGISKNSTKIAKAALEIGKSFISSIGKILPEIGKAGAKIAVKLVEGILGEKVAQKLERLFDSISDGFSDIADAAQKPLDKVNMLLGNLAEVILDIANAVIPVFLDGVGFIAGHLDALVPVLMGAAAGFAAFQIIQSISGLVAGLSTAFGILNTVMMANPAVLVISAIAGLAAGVAAMALSADDAAESFAALSKEQQASMDKISEHIEAWDSLKDASKERAQSVEAEYKHSKDLVSELKNIVDENGKIKKGYEDRATALLETLSNSTGIEYEVIDGQIQAYDELIGKIDEAIEKKKLESMLAAYQTQYEDALRNSIQAEKEYIEASNILADKQKEYRDLQYDIARAMDRWGAGTNTQTYLMEKYGMTLDEAQEATALMTETIAEQEQKVNDCARAMMEHDATIRNYDDTYGAMQSGNINGANDAIVKLSNTMLTAETADRESLQRQVQDVESELESMRAAYENGNTLITEEDIAAKQNQLRLAKAELGKWSNAHRTAAEDAQKQLNDAQNEGLKKAEDSLKESVNTMEGTVDSMDLASPGSESMVDYNKAIKAGGDTAKKTASEIAQGIKRNASVDLTQTGRNIAQGLVNGLASMAGTIASTALSMGRLAVQKVKQGAEVNSPSRATMRIGGFIDEGLAVGMEKKQKDVADTAGFVAEIPLEKMRAAIKAAGNENLMSVLVNKMKAAVATETSGGKLLRMANGGNVNKEAAFAPRISSETNDERSRPIYVETHVMIGDETELAVALTPAIEKEMAFRQ